MLHAGLDLSRRRLGVCLVDDAGELVAQLAAAPDTMATRTRWSPPACCTTSWRTRQPARTRLTALGSLSAVIWSDHRPRSARGRTGARRNPPPRSPRRVIDHVPRVVLRRVDLPACLGRVVPLHRSPRGPRPTCAFPRPPELVPPTGDLRPGRRADMSLSCTPARSTSAVEPKRAGTIARVSHDLAQQGCALVGPSISTDGRTWLIPCDWDRVQTRARERRQGAMHRFPLDRPNSTPQAAFGPRGRVMLLTRIMRFAGTSSRGDRI